MVAREVAQIQHHSTDYYRVLQLHSNADAALVDQAYWRLARLHNAAIPTDPDAQAKLDTLNEAYTVLGSPLHRRNYDRARSGRPFADLRLNKPASRLSPVVPTDVVIARLRQRSRRKLLRLALPNLKALPILVVASTASVIVLASAALINGAPPALVFGLVVIAVGFTATALTSKAGLPTMPARPTPAQAKRPANLGGSPIPGGRSQPIRKLVYQLYAKHPHLGPSDLQTVARYALLSQRFMRGERRAARQDAAANDQQWLLFAAEQRELAAELRQHEAALGFTAAGTKPSLSS